MFPWSENKLLRKALALYAGDHVLAHVLRDGHRSLVPHGDTQDVTVMFIDVAGFTTVDRSLTAKGLTAMISSWLTLFTNKILEFGGTLDTYIGDAVSAWWGPEHGDAHPRNACLCAKAMVAGLDELIGEYRAKGWPEMKVCIGINTGKVTLGTYGTATRLRFTVLGDAVNVASAYVGSPITHTRTPYCYPK